MRPKILHVGELIFLVPELARMDEESARLEDLLKQPWMDDCISSVPWGADTDASRHPVIVHLHGIIGPSENRGWHQAFWTDTPAEAGTALHHAWLNAYKQDGAGTHIKVYSPLESDVVTAITSYFTRLPMAFQQGDELWEDGDYCPLKYALLRNAQAPGQAILAYPHCHESAFTVLGKSGGLLIETQQGGSPMPAEELHRSLMRRCYGVADMTAALAPTAACMKSGCAYGVAKECMTASEHDHDDMFRRLRTKDMPRSPGR